MLSETGLQPAAIDAEASGSLSHRAVPCHTQCRFGTALASAGCIGNSSGAVTMTWNCNAEHANARAIAIAVVMFVLLGSRVGPIQARVIPGADNPNAYTEKQYIEDLIAFHRRSMSEAYAQVGKRDPRWDENAVKFLDAMAVRMASSAVSERHARPEPTFKQTADFAKAAIDGGCDDPLVLDLYASALAQLGRSAEAAKISLGNIDAMRASKYPANRIAGAVSRARAYVNARRDPQETAKFQVLEADANVEMAKQVTNSGVARRLIARILQGYVERMPGPDAMAIVDRLRLAYADKWLTAYLGAVVETRLGWDARGEGLAGQVPQQNWQGFGEHLQRGRALAVQAHQIEPQYPEAPTLLIKISMARGGGGGGGGVANDSPRGWFDRAVAGQFDYSPAYEQLHTAMRPRWGGSVEQMYQFAMECAATRRYDTLVPGLTEYSLMIICSDDDGRLDVYRRPGTRESLREAMLGMAREAPNADAADKWLAKLGAIAWRLGNYDDCQQAITEMKGAPARPEMNAYWSFSGASGPQVVAAVNALVGKDRGALQQAEQVARSGNAQAALASYETVLGTLHDDERATAAARPFVQSRIAELKLLRAIERGDWVDLIPDEHLLGWYANSGNWSSDGKTLVGESDGRNPPQLVFGSTLPRRLEIQAKFEIEGGDDVPANLDPSIQWFLKVNIGGANVLALNPLKAEASLQRVPHPEQRQAITLQKSNDLVIRMYDGHSLTTCNGQRLFHIDDGDTDDPLYREGGLFGIGSPIRVQGIRFRITQLRARTLDALWTADR
jgi:hypothetical protein